MTASMLDKSDPQVFFRTLKRDKLDRETIRVMVDGKPVAIDAESCGLFAIHPNIDDGEQWTLTHVLTGTAINSGFSSRRKAHEGLVALLMVIDLGDWRFKRLEDMPAACHKPGMMLRDLARGFYGSAKHTFDSLRG